MLVAAWIFPLPTWAKANEPSSADTCAVIRTIDPDPVHGLLVSLSLQEGAVVNTPAGERQTTAASDIVRVTFDGPKETDGEEGSSDIAPAGDITFVLAGGDRITGRVVGSRKDTVAVQTIDLGEVEVPMEALSRLTTRQSSAAAFRTSVDWFFRTRHAGEDAVLLTNGDVIRGFITAIDADGLAIDGPSGPVQAPHRLVVAAQIAHAPPSPPTALHAILGLRKSGRVTATALEIDGREVRARLQSGAQARLGIERVATIDMGGGRWVWLSERPPLSFEHIPMLSLGWEFNNDRNVRGGPLAVAGTVYERGIGVHSRSVLVYELDAAYREFVTSCGMDDDSGPLADVNVSILVDGQKRYEKAHVRRGTLVGPVRLDVRRAGRIELIVDFGDNGDVQDRFDWIEPALIR